MEFFSKPYLSIATIALLSLTLQAAESQPAFTLHLIGDSTMAPRDHTTGNPEYGWGEALQGFFKEEITVRNHAIGGRSSKSFINEGRWEKAKQEIRRGDWVIIQFGHNDQKKHKPEKFADAQTEYRELLQTYVHETRELGANPIIVTSIYRRVFPKNGQLKDTLGEYPIVARETAEALNIPLIDLHKATGEIIETYGVKGSKALFLHLKPGENAYHPDGKRDNSHLSKAGAEVIAQAFVVDLRQQDIQLADSLAD